MFRFAHLVFGKGDESNENQENNQENDEMIQKCVDDDWILIDVEKDKQKENEIQPNEKASSLIVPNTAQAQCQQVDQTKPSLSPAEPSEGPTESSLSPTPVQAGHIMEESWFITPPPCFINHSNQINIETTPFENLLIEHPSMSVFGPSLPRTTSLSSLPSSLSSHASESSSATSSSATSSSNSVVTSQVYNNQQYQVQQTRPSRQQQQQRVQRPHNGNGNFASRAVAVNQWQDVLTSMQKSQTAHCQKFITKNRLERQNKVVYQTNRPQIRKIKMAMRPNGVYNNRKNC